MSAFDNGGMAEYVRQNDYGFTVGGPVWIPKIYNGKDKTFFFFSFEQFRQKLTNDTLPDTVPIAPYRQGDFSSLITTENRLVTTASGPYVDPLGRTIQSGTIFDPNTTTTVNGVLVRNPFPNNQIPVSRFDPAAVKILALIPQPLGPNASQAGANYLAPFDQSRGSNIPSIKVDQTVTEKLRMAFYFQRTNTSTPRTATGGRRGPAHPARPERRPSHAPDAMERHGAERNYPGYGRESRLCRQCRCLGGKPAPLRLPVYLCLP